MPPSNRRICRNRLLNALPEEYLRQSFADLEPVSLQLRDVIYNSGGPMDHVYFIEEGLASVLTSMSSGSTVEVGVIGREGMLGIPALFGAETSVQQVIIQIPGTALRMSSRDCKAVFD